MNLPRRCVFLASCLALPLAVSAADPAPAHSYAVTVQIGINADGTPDTNQEPKIVESDDPTGEHVLELLAMNLAMGQKYPPHVKNGQPAAFTAKVPFKFPIPDDEGPTAAEGLTKPSIHNAIKPLYPAELAATNTVGAAVLEIVISPTGTVTSARVLRATHPQFGESALAAVKLWTFVPAQRAGVAVESRWRLVIDFATNTDIPDWTWRVPPRPLLGTYTVVHATLPPAEAAPAAAEPAKPAETPAK